METQKGVLLAALIELLDSSSVVFQVTFPGRILPFGVVEMVGSNVHPGWIRNFTCVRRSDGFERSN